MPHDGRQDTAFKPDRALADGDVLETPEFRLRALHTPGSRVEPPVLLARGAEAALHRRSRHAGLDGGDLAARRRHDRVPRLARAAARVRAIGVRARPRPRDRENARRSAPPHRASPEARAEGGGCLRREESRDARRAGAARLRRRAAAGPSGRAPLAARAPAQAAARRAGHRGERELAAFCAERRRGARSAPL